jgi:hypothetical protein
VECEGDDYKLLWMGCVVARPGATNQGLHADGGHLFTGAASKGKGKGKGNDQGAPCTATAGTECLVHTHIVHGA